MNIKRYKVPAALQHYECETLRPPSKNNRIIPQSGRKQAKIKREVPSSGLESVTIGKLPSQSKWSSSKYSVLPDVNFYLPQAAVAPAPPIRTKRTIEKAVEQTIDPVLPNIIQRQSLQPEPAVIKPRLTRSVLPKVIKLDPSLEYLTITSPRNLKRYTIPLESSFQQSSTLRFIYGASRGFKEGRDGCICLSGTSIDACEAICDWLCYGEVKGIGNVYEVLEHAVYLDIQGLIDVCLDKIARHAGTKI